MPAHHHMMNHGGTSGNNSSRESQQQSSNQLLPTQHASHQFAASIAQNQQSHQHHQQHYSMPFCHNNPQMMDVSTHPAQQQHPSASVQHHFQAHQQHTFAQQSAFSSHTNATMMPQMQQQSSIANPFIDPSLIQQQQIQLHRTHFLHLIAHIFKNIVRLKCDHGDSNHDMDTSSSGESGRKLGDSFYRSRVPSISVEDYLNRIIKHAHVSDECLIFAIIYIDRLVRRHRDFQVCPHTIHRLIITSIMTAIKFHSDIFNYNSYYAQVGGISRSEMNHCELEFLYMLNFSLMVKPEEFIRYRSEVFSFWNQVQSPANLVQNIPVTSHVQHAYQNGMVSTNDASCQQVNHHQQQNQQNASTQQAMQMHPYLKHVQQLQHERTRNSSMQQQMHTQLSGMKVPSQMVAAANYHTFQQQNSTNISVQPMHNQTFKTNHMEQQAQRSDSSGPFVHMPPPGGG